MLEATFGGPDKTQINKSFLPIPPLSPPRFHAITAFVGSSQGMMIQLFSTLFFCGGVTQSENEVDQTSQIRLTGRLPGSA